MSLHPAFTARNIRSWTDDQLRVAVGQHRSWRDVARALGLRPTSTHSIRRHAARLHLDTSHFAGRRLWTDEELKAAVSRAASWTEALRLLGVKETSAFRIRAKGHAARLGLDVSHLTGARYAGPSIDLYATAPHPKMLRAAAASIATAWFLLRGYPTATPTEPQAYDLLVTFPDGMKRVQVKSTTFRLPSGRWQVKVGRRPYSLDKTAGRAPYDPDALDFFFVVDGAGGLYLVPSRVLAGRLEITIDHYPEYRVGDAARHPTAASVKRLRRVRFVWLARRWLRGRQCGGAGSRG
jgi:PD-(D/E)XK endonuclease